jgi:hypothetical protein
VLRTIRDQLLNSVMLEVVYFEGGGGGGGGLKDSKFEDRLLSAHMCSCGNRGVLKLG